MDKGHSQACQVQWLCMILVTLLQRIYELEARLGKNSSNSDKPPSSDSPYTGPEQDAFKEGKKTTRKPRGGQPGHKGHKQELLEPTETEDVFPDCCQCGGTEFEDQGVFYTHQEIEFPTITMIIRHLILVRYLLVSFLLRKVLTGHLYLCNIFNIFYNYQSF